MRQQPIAIGKLTLRLDGPIAYRGEILAQLVADGLAEAGIHPSVALLSAVHLSVPAGGDETAEDLAQLIVSSILRELERSL